jgi:hypothetical protein
VNTTQPEAIPKLSSKAPDGMTEADEKCYEARYGDLNGLPGRRHFQDVGSAEGRLRTCASNLTEYQTQKYLDQYPDLQHAFGRKGRAPNALARDHWTDYGFNEKRDVSRADWDSLFRCGDVSIHDPWDTTESSCKCHGTMHMGLLRAPDSKKELVTLDEMRSWKTWEKPSDGKTFIPCSAVSMGFDPHELEDVDYQCWCEPKP